MSADEFLKREREILGNDADLFASSDAAPAGAGAFDLPSTDFPDLGDGETVPDAPTPTAAAAAASAPDAGFPSIDALGDAPPSQPQVNITGVEADDPADAELDKFQSAYPDVDELMPAELKTIPVASNFQYGSSPYSPGPSSPQPPAAFASGSSAAGGRPASPESDAIAAWRARQQDEIAARDAKSKKAREERVGQAEKDIDGFYEKYNKGKEQAIKENKENEASFLAALEAKLGEGTAWERVCDLVGLANSQSKTLARSVPGGSDLGRMKEVLLKLRRQGESAPGAAGY